jgi:hypothetical protein
MIRVNHYHVPFIISQSCSQPASEYICRLFTEHFLGCCIAVGLILPTEVCPCNLSSFNEGGVRLCLLGIIV